MTWIYSHITSSFKQQAQAIRNYPTAAGIILLIAVVNLTTGIYHHELPHRLGYLFAMWLCAFVTDLVVSIKSSPAVGFPVKHPVKNEVLVILIVTVLIVAGLCIRFLSDWQHLAGLRRLAVIFIPVTFPVLLVVIYLFIYKYTCKELGINFRYWYLALIVHLLIGGTMFLVAPEKSHWLESFHNFALADFFFAAISEEFLRMLMQTRFALLFNNKGLGFVLATIIWAMMHIPVWSQYFKTEGASLAFFGVMDLLPIGFLWGYITYRTKSLLPSVLVHGLNLWGIQNF